MRKVYVAPSLFNKAKLKLSGYNLKKVYYILESYGIDTSNIETEFDVAIAQYLLNPNAKAEELVFEDEKQQSMFTTVEEKRKSKKSKNFRHNTSQFILQI